jgi:HK97 family phage prohead protease
MKPEKRTFQMDELRVVRGDDGEPARLEGHAAVFDKWSVDLGGFREKIARGAFKTAIKDDDVRAPWNHDSNIVLGRNTSGTLEMREDKTGLAISITPPDTQFVRDVVLAPIERGDVDQMSFAFSTRKDQWELKDDAPDERTLLDVGLSDVSPVTYPAYPDTDIAVRSLDKWREEHRPDTATPALDAARLKQASTML